MTMALSYSRISDFRQCPNKFKLKYIDKAQNFQLKDEDKGPALVRGGNIHKGLERYVVSKLAGQDPNITLPEVISTAPIIDKIMKSYSVMPEKQIAIDVDFNQVDWFSKQAWFRVIYDLIGFGPDLLLVDYKTGKFTDYSGSMDELGQLHFAALIGMTLSPKFHKCSSVYLYVDHKKTISCNVTRDDYDHMKNKLIEEHEMINAEDVFAPKKNQYCRWCEATNKQCSFGAKVVN